MRVRRGGDLSRAENASELRNAPNGRWFSPASARASRRSPRRSRGSLPSSPPSATGSRTARLAAASARTRICFLPTPASRSWTSAWSCAIWMGPSARPRDVRRRRHLRPRRLRRGALRASTRSPRTDWRRRTRCVPRRVRTRAVLVKLRTEQVAGFDLRCLDAYRWHPQTARFPDGLERDPHEVRSEPFDADEVDLQTRLRDGLLKSTAGMKGARQSDDESRSGDDESRSGDASAAWERDAVVRVTATSTGPWNAVAFWFEAELFSSGGAVPDENEKSPPPDRSSFARRARPPPARIILIRVLIRRRRPRPTPRPRSVSGCSTWTSRGRRPGRRSSSG